jgi:tyrosinase
MFQQLLHESAQRISEQYTSEKETWKTAADTLRQPYWDWAHNSVPPAEVISMDKVTITTPKGRVSVDNPLRHYKFHPIDPSFDQASSDGRFKVWPTTLRQPTPPSAPDAKDDVGRLQRWRFSLIFVSATIQNYR